MELNLNTTYLKFFHDAVLSGSVSESAKRNFVTQSAVSQAISKLEKALGVQLCQHKKQKFILTEEGKLVFEHAKHVFSSVRNLYDALDHFQEKPRMPLNFVSTHSIGLSLLPYVLPKFQKDFPEITVNFLFGGLTQIRGWLKQGIAEFALVLASGEFSDYSLKPLYSGEFTLFQHKDEPGDPMEQGIYVERKEGFLVKKFLKQCEKPFPIRAELNSWELVTRCMQGGGYGFIPDLFQYGSRYPELVPVEWDVPRIPYQVCAANLRGEVLSFSAKSFLEYF